MFSTTNKLILYFLTEAYSIQCSLSLCSEEKRSISKFLSYAHTADSNFMIFSKTGLLLQMSFLKYYFSIFSPLEKSIVLPRRVLSNVESQHMSVLCIFRTPNAFIYLTILNVYLVRLLFIPLLI